MFQTRGVGCFPRLLLVFINTASINMVDGNIQGLGNVTDVHSTTNGQRNLPREKGVEEFFASGLQALYYVFFVKFLFYSSSHPCISFIFLPILSLSTALLFCISCFPFKHFFWSPFSKLIWSLSARFLIPYFHTEICLSWENNEPVLTLKQPQGLNTLLKYFTSKPRLVHTSTSET